MQQLRACTTCGQQAILVRNSFGVLPTMLVFGHSCTALSCKARFPQLNANYAWVASCSSCSRGARNMWHSCLMTFSVFLPRLLHVELMPSLHFFFPCLELLLPESFRACFPVPWRGRNLQMRGSLGRVSQHDADGAVLEGRSHPAQCVCPFLHADGHLFGIERANIVVRGPFHVQGLSLEMRERHERRAAAATRTLKHSTLRGCQLCTWKLLQHVSCCCVAMSGAIFKLLHERTAVASSASMTSKYSLCMRRVCFWLAIFMRAFCC